MNSKPDTTDSSVHTIQWMVLFRYLIGLAVAIAVGYTIWKAVGQLQAQEFRLSRINFLWWFAAIITYIGAMSLSALFWHRVLLAMDQHPRLYDSLTAFFISQLGKYVPGKAMVVVLRTDRIRGDNVTIGPAIVSVFIETLTWLFTGSIIASVLLLLLFDNQLLQITAAIMMIVSGFLTAPPVIRWFAHRLGHVKGKKTGKVMMSLTVKVMAPGWLLLATGWLLSGLSLWLVLRGLPDVSIAWEDYWLCLTCVTLSTAVGFASLLPGGLGVRELVMIPLLSTRFDAAIVVVAVVAIRIVWLISELLTAAICHTATKTGDVG